MLSEPDAVAGAGQGPAAPAGIQLVDSMYRAFICLCVVLLASGTLSAEEVKGKLKAVDVKKATVTVTADGKDQTFKMIENAKFLDAKGKPLDGGLKSSALKPGALVEVTFTCDGFHTLRIVDVK